MNQRWRDRRDSYRVPSEVIRTHEHEVDALDDDARAKAFVLAHHYSGCYPAARRRFGLYRGSDLVGVAVFSQPTSDKVLTNVFPCAAQEALELGRFVLLDTVAGNGETWFLARCFERLRVEGFYGVVSFSDPVARTMASGQVVFPGHVGTIYQAANAVYLGRATVRTLRLLHDGQVFSARTAQKIRSGERGWRHATEQLVRAGARQPAAGEDPRAWLREALGGVTRTLRHQGNHRYAWGLQRRGHSALRPGLAYPKRAS